MDGPEYMIIGHLYGHFYKRQPKYVEDFSNAESAYARMQGCLAQHCANVLEVVNRCTVGLFYGW